MTIPSGIVVAFGTLGQIWDGEAPIDPIEDPGLLAAAAEEPVAAGMVVDPEDVDPVVEPATVAVPNSAITARATTAAVATEAVPAHHRRDANRRDAHFETNLLALPTMIITLPFVIFVLSEESVPMNLPRKHRSEM